MKKQTLWIVRDRERTCYEYGIYYKEPFPVTSGFNKGDFGCNYRVASVFNIKKLFPGLKLKKGEKRQFTISEK